MALQNIRRSVMLYSQILGTFLSKTGKKLPLACCALQQCTHSTDVLSFLPELSVAQPPSPLYIPSDFAPLGSSDWEYFKNLLLAAFEMSNEGTAVSFRLCSTLLPLAVRANNLFPLFRLAITKLKL